MVRKTLEQHLACGDETLMLLNFSPCRRTFFFFGTHILLWFSSLSAWPWKCRFSHFQTVDKLFIRVYLHICFRLSPPGDSWLKSLVHTYTHRVLSNLHFLTLRAVLRVMAGFFQHSGQLLYGVLHKQESGALPSARCLTGDTVCVPQLHSRFPALPPHTHIIHPEPFYLYGNLGSTAGIRQSTVIH